MYKSTTLENVCGIFIRRTFHGMGKRDTYIRSASVRENGRAAYYKMLKSVHQGELVQVRRGVYADVEQLADGMIDIESIVPEGILCLWSAWSIHRLTTSMPQAFHVAVKRDRKVVIPSFPQIALYHYTASILDIGVVNMVVEGYSVRIYDMERCVCDAVKFRNKIGMDICAEIIDNYLSRAERNISKLMDYARVLRVGT